MAFMYRSFSTLTTLGYGDISPISPSATSLAILLVVFGQIYLTILLGIMLAKFLQREEVDSTYWRCALRILSLFAEKNFSANASPNCWVTAATSTSTFPT
ncbi:MAG: two pore domain potassium channel family protein [Candidatus Peribacteria bacterium]|nr:MAG: two pore domain potassium channel family protein [Candidatus Peribacteria bacterium]